MLKQQKKKKTTLQKSNFLFALTFMMFNDSFNVVYVSEQHSEIAKNKKIKKMKFLFQ